MDAPRPALPMPVTAALTDGLLLGYTAARVTGGSDACLNGVQAWNKFVDGWSK